MHINADGEIKREIGGIMRSNAEHLGNNKKIKAKTQSLQACGHTQFSSGDTVILLPGSTKLLLQLLALGKLDDTLIPVPRKDECTQKLTSRSRKISR